MIWCGADILTIIHTKYTIHVRHLNHPKPSLTTCCCSVAQSCLTLRDPMDGAWQVSLSLTISWSLPTFISIVSVMPSSHLILWHPLLHLPSIFPSIRVFYNELAVCIRWSKYWNFSFSPPPPSSWKNCVPWNQPLLPKKFEYHWYTRYITLKLAFHF